MMRSLKGVLGSSRMKMVLPQGDATVQTKAEIRDANTFNIQFPAMNGELPTTAVARADGQRVGILISGEPETTGSTSNGSGWDVRPVAKPIAKNGVPAEAIELPRMILGNFIDGRPSFAQFVSAAQKAGHATSVEERTSEYKGRKIKNLRIISERKLGVAKGAGASRIEIVVDANLYLPVTVKANFQRPGERPTSVLWTTEWRNNQKFDSKKFKVPSD